MKDLGASTTHGIARAHGVLGVRHARPGRCSPRCSAGSRRAARTACCPFVLAARVRRDLAAARTTSRRSRSSTFGLAGLVLLGVASAHDQLRAGGAHRDGRRPSRAGSSRATRSATASPRSARDRCRTPAPSCRRCSASPPSSRWRWPRSASCSPECGPPPRSASGGRSLRRRRRRRLGGCWLRRQPCRRHVGDRDGDDHDGHEREAVGLRETAW